MCPTQSLASRGFADDLYTAFVGELQFISEWRSGRLPLLGAMVRIRQLYRANPWLWDCIP
jgi:hypothetical protein